MVKPEVAGTEGFAPDQIFSISMFSSPIPTRRSNSIFHHISSRTHYRNVPPGWAHTVLDQLDSKFEGSIRSNYNAVTSTIWIRARPSPFHDCRQTCPGKAGGIVLDLQSPLKMTAVFVRGPYASSRKEPDLLVRLDNQPLPSLVIESGWSEPLSRFRDDMDLWLVGGQGQVKATIIFNWQRVGDTNTVRGAVELYSLDRNGMPRLQQNLVVFPAPPAAQAAAQRLVLKRKDIFGAHVFQGQNPNDQFASSIDLLRQKATEALALMNLVPA